MGVTNALALPFPELTETADGPDAFSDIANAVEDYFFDRLLPAGVTVPRTPAYDWGSGTTPPISTTPGLRAGDSYTHTSHGVLFWNGSAWRQIASSSAATAPLYDGQLRYNPTTKGLETGRGTVWEAASIQVPRAKLMGTGTFNVASGTNVPITLDTSVRAIGMTTDTTTGRITCTRAGTYLVSGSVNLNTLVTGFTLSRHIAFLMVNGVLVPEAQNRSDPQTASTHAIATAAIALDLAVNDYVQLGARQETGVVRAVDRTSSFLQATWVGV